MRMVKLVACVSGGSGVCVCVYDVMCVCGTQRVVDSLMQSSVTV